MSIPNAPVGLLGNAPMQTQLVDNQRSVTPPWGGWLNWLRQWLFLNIPSIINFKSVYSSADPIANGAFGDNIHDDTAIVQQTINNTGGVLYLRPGTLFATSSTISVTSGSPIFIYGGGGLFSTANPVISISTASVNSVQFLNVKFFTNTSGATAISMANTVGNWNSIVDCFFGAPGLNGVGILLNSNATPVNIVGCTFNSNILTGVSLTTQSDVNIVGCEFRGPGTPVSTSGTCVYKLRGCGLTPDVYSTAETAATASAGGGAALPATVNTFIQVQVVLAGVLTTVKIPAFSP